MALSPHFPLPKKIALFVKFALFVLPLSNGAKSDRRIKQAIECSTAPSFFPSKKWIKLIPKASDVSHLPQAWEGEAPPIWASGQRSWAVVIYTAGLFYHRWDGTIRTYLLSATGRPVTGASKHTFQRNHVMDANTPEFRSAPSIDHVLTWISHLPHSTMERLARRRSGLWEPFG